MKSLVPLLLVYAVSLTPTWADTWTATDGRTLEGEFVRYDFSENTVTIQRESDGHYFEIPETRLVHADLLKAVKLANENVEPYWYTDCATARAENPKRRCLFFYCNGSDPEAFELFCHKLLLRERFKQSLDYRYVIVCIQEELPEELMQTTYRKKEGELVPIEKAPPPAGTPYLICVDFHQELDSNGTRNPNYYDLTIIPGSRSKGGADPFKTVTPSGQKLIPLEEIEKLVQHYPRDRFREK